MVIFKKASGNLRYGDGSKPCTPVVHIKIAGLKWMFIPVKMVLIGIDPYPYGKSACFFLVHFFFELVKHHKGPFSMAVQGFLGGMMLSRQKLGTQHGSLKTQEQQT